MVGFVPISDQDGHIGSWRGEGDGNGRAAQDFDGSESAGGFVESEGREVIEGPDLVLHLKLVREVLAWWDRAVCTSHTILE